VNWVHGAWLNKTSVFVSSTSLLAVTNNQPRSDMSTYLFAEVYLPLGHLTLHAYFSLCLF